jgi:hypothetical protein
MKPEDELKSENALLKLKLQLEHGMNMSESSELGPEMENEWLNNIYLFEQQHKNAKQVKVFEVIGCPAFKKHDELNKEETSKELNRLLDLMAEKEIVLDILCQYDDLVIYRFVTEELFEHEMDGIRIPGMVLHFIYEEFYPNHDYDLRRYATEFIETLLSGKWNSEFDTSTLASMVQFFGKDYDNDAISNIILAFQESYGSFKIEELEIENVNFNIERENATVQIQLTYSAQPPGGSNMIHAGKSILGFIMQWDYWRINSFRLPGFGN